jgi:pimeloyl-ACP methyl ester carboxylesterase
MSAPRGSAEAAPTTATFVLLPGAGGDSWYWHLVASRLRAWRHEVLTPDLPADDDSAELGEYADTVVDAVGDRAGDGTRATCMRCSSLFRGEATRAPPGAT